ncbi:LD-carboxypeptidase [Bacillus sp. B15-48]|uniref:S66 peptidase family protein n=1 Tax=Bacillus sp. B15-48 TaxID=1548601 RepID=UPI00193FC50F|nr:LD-carboxypeptidase [Bacillus sp. B15-48]MBM4763414.1 LD-carboxypeptidase [Bacillus sp. B15-48]
MNLMKPKKLKKGDTVGIIAPAGTPQREKLEKGVEFLREVGLKTKLGRHIYRKNGYLAGSDEERVEDLHSMFADSEVKAIFCARGGYGTARIAERIDYELIKKNPKIFWGYSDITFLHLAIQKRTGLVTFHGPMIASDYGSDEIDSLTKNSLKQLFEPNPLQYSTEQSPLETVVDGVAFGPLIGGNLTLITSTLGTSFEIDTNGKILLIEEINEEPRAIDRMFNQLSMAGKLEGAAGILLGDFHHCISESPASFELEEVLEHYIKRVNKPTLAGLKIGHCQPNLAVPLGVNAILDSRQQQLIVENGTLS